MVFPERSWHWPSLARARTNVCSAVLLDGTRAFGVARGERGREDSIGLGGEGECGVYGTRKDQVDAEQQTGNPQGGRGPTDQ
jgi:hypothetical protein